MIGRFMWVVGFLLAIGVTCSARQTAAPAISTPQANALLDPFSSPEMKALASAIMEKIRANRITSIVVVGGGTSEFKVSELGVSLRDELNEELARQAGEVRVLSSADVREVLKRNRVSESMIYCNGLADWISAYSQADAAVILQLDGLKDARNMISVEMFNERKKKTIDKKTKVVVPDAKFENSIMLTNEQEISASREYHPLIDASVSAGGKNGITMAMCIHCPKPDYTEEGRQLRFAGTVYLEAIVRIDGTADEVRVTKPIGHGLDGASVTALLGWKFGPSVDSDGHPVPTRVPFRMAFQLY